jgi:hypothetical protein
MLNRGTLLALLLCASLPAHALQPGAAVAPWTLKDQFDRPYTFGPETRVLLVARSMGAARMLDSALAEAPAGYLDSRRVAYIADIERMPAIARALAIPAMRSARYRILLDTQGAVAPGYEGAREGVQWLEVEGGTLKAEKRFDEAPALRQALDALPTAPPL